MMAERLSDERLRGLCGIPEAMPWKEVPRMSLEILALRALCDEVYQVVGVLAAAAGVFDTDAVERVLDNLAAAGDGKPLPHATLIPFQVTAGPVAPGDAARPSRGAREAVMRDTPDAQLERDDEPWVHPEVAACSAGYAQGYEQAIADQLKYTGPVMPEIPSDAVLDAADIARNKGASLRVYDAIRTALLKEQERAK